jgi:uncharacterized protein YkwD
MIGLVVALVLALIPGGYDDLGYCGRKIVDHHNRVRAEAGLPALTVDWRMHIYALRHSREMREAGTGLPFHTAYPTYSENVGAGPDILTVNVAWAESPGHLGNILGDYTEIGPGCARRDGRVYATVAFR